MLLLMSGAFGSSSPHFPGSARTSRPPGYSNTGSIKTDSGRLGFTPVQRSARASSDRCSSESSQRSRLRRVRGAAPERS
ncbi:hypothetical protein [Rhodococcus sp. BH4]|uniref:hypothetical protein n=1 Tax=Rhodococcus sp. BH4 TaxID=1807790 RepID=UPI003FA75F01